MGAPDVRFASDRLMQCLSSLTLHARLERPARLDYDHLVYFSLDWNGRMWYEMGNKTGVK